uniref:MKRN2 opposite strand n=1 Tax=Xenopus tropicalis TaxID=8364 RepID=A0A803K3V9_XENTR
MHRELLKFSHCGWDIYCPCVPQQCPVCGEAAVSSWRLEEAPVSIPSPLVSGHSQPCSFVLRPTWGNFLGEYDGSADLHVGISSSTGTVYHYNESGVHKDSVGWEQSVSVPLVPAHQHALLHQWDSYLEEFSAADNWRPHRYQEADQNCYTFALTFINRVLLVQEKEPFSKEEFTARVHETACSQSADAPSREDICPLARNRNHLHS